MKSILLTKKDLTSGVELPGDVKNVLTFIAGWNHDYELVLWYDDLWIYVCQSRYGLWTTYEAENFKSGLIAAHVIDPLFCGLFSVEKIQRPSDGYEESVVAFSFRRYYCR